MSEISKNEALILKYLASKNQEIEESNIEIKGLSRQDIASATSWLQVKGLIDVKTREEVAYVLTDEGKRYAENGLPELRAYSILKRKGKLSLRDLQEAMPDEYKIVLAQLAKFGITPKNGVLEYSDGHIEAEISRRQRFLSDLNTDDQEMIEHFKRRKNVIEEKKRSVRIVSINSKGLEQLNNFDQFEAIGEIDSGIITSQAWKTAPFRKYDLDAPVSPTKSYAKHPLVYFINEIRRIFLDMGFTEMSGHYIESALWDMDALFIPQDHPARDMQDTFYVKDSNFTIEHPEIEKRIKRIHERGFDGYSGWGYRWSSDDGKKLILRTHTTVTTARYLYEHNTYPQAIFSVEKVFRHESVDWKHLAEFYQIEGAVYDKNVSVATLKWILRTFYGKLGFEKIRLVPSYYPYTEPSLDVVVEVDGKEMELGGSGIFRPEVGKILGLKAPVMAWGMGLERLAMLYYGLTDVRDLYNTDFSFLEGYKIKY
ncbi:tRNA synthetase Phea [Thermoplasma volcanium GSS1]|uniref:Phenylalanine--tRNA ligase alpha subunit n=1 Tax=Thermoplasma volcanium (strain ATCC 51530 / DSM 4299 / JCM 9571 / NBRC 15438 / GSS1) TaxID=273116 RepID=SYFA_THEVO|nr:phenylalanine--tRNA ligase subunit alpha [Thermoplasma volcanium]Q979U4.1 RecName: Full=Phenylalanine--tRNA ligase alpha subunit; AltName: Full=Phenylalanyl-tRNA synthetase alpha subunit; Short=PheRS [Thermoplasma volcanium GSS1]BAB60208.1 tRNA synthetase Phea [Thermoplasma volcanium GSS1]